jgi:hypothetical protein
VLRSDGLAACWGVAFFEDPIIVEGPYAQVSAANLHACFLRGTTVECAPGAHAYPDAVEDVPDGSFESVASSLGHNCALRLDGSVACWGMPREYEVPLDQRFKALSLGGDWACGLTDEQLPVCWMLRCCVGPPEIPAVPLLAVSVGGLGICGVDMAGEVECWSDHESWLEQMAEPPAGPFVKLTVSSRSACALRPGGELACWGPGYDFGHQAPEGLLYRDVAMGSDHVCAITLEGELFCWGSDQYGQVTPPDFPG